MKPVLRKPNEAAFTLIEMLAVIAIMGIVTAMIVGMAGSAAKRRKIERVRGELAKLTTIIDSYYAKEGHYPPDNAFLVTLTNSVNTAQFAQLYDQYTQINSLLYELTGGSNFPGGSPPYFLSFTGSNVALIQFSDLYGLGGVANSDINEPHVFYNPLPAPKAYTNYPNWMFSGFATVPSVIELQGLLVPVDGVQALDKKQVTPFNYWHYDASTTNRHNQSSYDLWAEFTVGSGSNGPVNMTNGNW